MKPRKYGAGVGGVGLDGNSSKSTSPCGIGKTLHRPTPDYLQATDGAGLGSAETSWACCIRVRGRGAE